jgi:hypothetical protein
MGLKGLAHKKNGNTTQKKNHNFLSFLQKLREWHTKTKNYWDSVEISCKHTKKH